MKNKVESKIPELPIAYDHIFNVERFEHFLGRTMTMIETLGLSETQEKAFKDIIKQEIWYLWEHPWGIHDRYPTVSVPVSGK